MQRARLQPGGHWRRTPRQSGRRRGAERSSLRPRHTNSSPKNLRFLCLGLKTRDSLPAAPVPARSGQHGHLPCRRHRAQELRGRDAARKIVRRDTVDEARGEPRWRAIVEQHDEPALRCEPGREAVAFTRGRPASHDDGARLSFRAATSDQPSPCESINVGVDGPARVPRILCRALPH